MTFLSAIWAFKWKQMVRHSLNGSVFFSELSNGEQKTAGLWELLTSYLETAGSGSTAPPATGGTR